jgi:TP901 family phage tail tape measure protein
MMRRRADYHCESGGDAAAIQAATPVTLNMALSNRRSMEENAALLTGMKSAFQMSNDDRTHRRRAVDDDEQNGR